MYRPAQLASSDRKTSKPGLISFLLALGFPALIIVLLVISMVLEGRVDFVKQLDLWIALLTMIGGPIVHFTGLVLGIVGVFQKGRKKLLPILGVVLNGILLALAVIIVVFCLSLIAGALGAVR
ncbi:MAG TPA: hypothetical protein VE961_07435 [Pyrinomonadaceae bacterium]|nr:hypothetical protein [Pyrinomonadaceae bacterium]